MSFFRKLDVLNKRRKIFQERKITSRTNFLWQRFGVNGASGDEAEGVVLER